MDLLFIEQLDFQITNAQAQRLLHTTKTIAEAAAGACALVGIELVDYHSMVFRPLEDGKHTVVIGRSRAWCERMQR
jgi:hypothetical protein